MKRHQDIGHFGEEKGLREAPLSFAIVAIPGIALATQVVQASNHIAGVFKSRNIIDFEIFPPHLTIYMGGIDPEYINDLVEDLNPVLPSYISKELNIATVYREGSGFIAVECVIDFMLSALVKNIIAICKSNHQKSPQYRLRTLLKWETASQSVRDLIEAYGTERVPPNWRPHISIADVDEVNSIDALTIARSFITTPQSFPIVSIDMVDIGHSNERWRVLQRWTL